MYQNITEIVAKIYPTEETNNIFRSKYLHFLGEKSVAGSKDNNKNLNCFECVSQEAIFFVQNRSNKAIIMCDKDTITKQMLRFLTSIIELIYFRSFEEPCKTKYLYR